MLRKQLKRNHVLPFFANLITFLIDIQACGTTRY